MLFATSRSIHFVSCLRPPAWSESSGTGTSSFSTPSGLGVYQALIAARWEAAVSRGTPALTVQAGRLSKPIVESVGFAEVGQAHLNVDTLVD